MSSSVRFGILGGLLTIIWGLVVHFAQLYTQQWPIFIDIFLIVLTTVLSCVYYKKNEGQGFLTFTQGMKSGLQTIFIFVLITLIWTVVYSKLINPDLVNMIKNNAVTKMEAQNAPDDQINMTVQMIEKYYLLVSGVFITLLYLFLGLIVSLITSAIIKKEKPMDMNIGTN